MKKSIFRMYDIRGIFPDDLDPDTVRRLGRSLAELAGEDGTIAIGRDCRESGAQLALWLAQGAASASCRIIDLGMQTTPMTYFAACTLKPDATVMITGSHNPPAYNGFKLMKGLHTLYGDEIEEIRAGMEEGGEVSSFPDEPSVEKHSVREDYLDRLRCEFAFARSLTVVVDAGNGTGGDCSVQLLRELGCRVIPLFCDADGSFPNHHPDPTVEENLLDVRRAVLEYGADIGLAFDGDADRLGILDESGRVIWGDRILIILARALLESHPGAKIISEVKASNLFFSEVRKAGGLPVMSPTGHSIIKEAMVREDALLAGEMSGHIFFRDRYYGYDDALYAALRLLEIMAYREEPLSNLLADIPDVYSTPEIREECSEEQKFALVDIVKKKLLEDGYRIIDIDGVRVEFPDGWALLRASNTQPVLVLRFEAESKEKLEQYRKLILTELQEARRILDAKGTD
jgi:phosphomannomutase/phosphoglucomutase